MKKILAVLATVLIGLGALLLISAPSWAAEDDTVAIDKFDTTFVYQGDNAWTVTTHVPNAAIHNIGSRQAWLCNENFVGEGIEACVPGRTYVTNGEILGDRSCVYIQGDNPAWDTVPDTEKEVCAPLTPPTPEPSATPTTSPSSTPSPEPTESASPTPSPSATFVPTPTPTPTSKPSSSPTPSATPTPEPSRTPEPTVTPSAPVEVPVASPSPSETSVAAPSAPGTGPAELARTGVAHDAQSMIWMLTFGALVVAVGVLLLFAPVLARSRRLSRRRR